MVSTPDVDAASPGHVRGATSVDGLLHGDAHSKNVLLPRNNNDALGNPIAKLVDFGTSRMTPEQRVSRFRLIAAR
jgi:Ser/Thr protein kinase RdoA (MazF antagonist)